MNFALSIDISPLEKRGFVHIPGFLNSTEIDLLCQDFQQAKAVETDNYAMKHVSPEAFSKIADKLETLIKMIQQNTSINVDQFDGPGIYFPNWKEEATLTNPEPSLQQFPWHQDHESYFLLQDHSNYLNFYLPIIKPIPEKSNLTIIPTDKLQALSPSVAEQLTGRGATRIVKDGDVDVILDDDGGGIMARLNLKVTQLEETPHLNAGDLLLLKGDVLHKTQDADTRRVAVSFRLLNSQSIIQRKKLVRGGLVKTVMMLNSWKKYELELRYFDLIQSETATFNDILQYIESNTVPSNVGRINFMLRLLSERFQDGNIFKILLDLPLLKLLLQK